MKASDSLQMPGQRHRIFGPWPFWACRGQGWTPPTAERELSRLVVNETPDTWGQTFISTPTNPATTPHPPLLGSPRCFSRNSMEEPHFHWQQNQLTNQRRAGVGKNLKECSHDVRSKWEKEQVQKEVSVSSSVAAPEFGV